MEYSNQHKNRILHFPFRLDPVMPDNYLLSNRAACYSQLWYQAVNQFYLRRHLKQICLDEFKTVPSIVQKRLAHIPKMPICNLQ